MSQVVNIVVISEDTLYCPRVITRTNKGNFSWPKTVSGVTVEHLCETGENRHFSDPLFLVKFAVFCSEDEHVQFAVFILRAFIGVRGAQPTTGIPHL